MGIVFGVSGAEEPKYDVLKHIPYEIRIYKACFVAETTANDMNEAFQKLARYIGVFGDPENRIDEQIASSTEEGVPEEGRSVKMAMTTPALTKKSTMQFILPSEYAQISDIPVPTDPNVSIKLIPKRAVAVLAYYGWNSTGREKKKYQTLFEMLQNDGVLEVTESKKKYPKEDAKSTLETIEEELKSATTQVFSMPYEVAQYHPSYTLPCFRRLEVWITLNPRNRRVAEMLRSYADKTYSVRTAMRELLDTDYADPLDAEFGEEKADVNNTLEVPTTTALRRRAKMIISSADKFLEK